MRGPPTQWFILVVEGLKMLFCHFFRDPVWLVGLLELTLLLEVGSFVVQNFRKTEVESWRYPKVISMM